MGKGRLEASVGVSLMWLVPDRRIEHVIDDRAG